MPAPLSQLETQINHKFKDSGLLETALTHSSTASGVNYERLEFLGDRVLGLAMAELLYRRFPEEPEGDLAKRLATLVQGECLAGVSKEMGLGSYVSFSDAEALSGGADNTNILADVFESLIGALYLDSDFTTCQSLIEKLWGDRLDVMKPPPQHPKTRVQEWAQSQGMDLPVYEITEQHGPDHAPLFDVKLTVFGHDPITAQGRSRQAAEKQAAKNFMKKLDEGKGA